jgi:hypothetical protein
MHRGFEPTEEFPITRNAKGKKKKKMATEEANSTKILLEEPSVDWRHRPGSLRINQLVCTPVVDLLDGVGSFPLWLELPFRLMCDNDRAP